MRQFVELQSAADDALPVPFVGHFGALTSHHSVHLLRVPKTMFQVCWISVASSTLTDELNPGQPATVSTGKAIAGNSAPKAMQFYAPLSHVFGCILKADIRFHFLKKLSSPEQQIIDRLLDEGSVCCGLLDKAIVLRLLSRGLVYLEVPIGSDDYVFGTHLVPTLDGFVMNRVQGDYFETLLYKNADPTASPALKMCTCTAHGPRVTMPMRTRRAQPVRVWPPRPLTNCPSSVPMHSLLICPWHC
ncbi:hypothetical protein niasHT_023411 [Heterodera trifolii]|uniref:FAM91 N-terminal domain-containing protein n=1 Tax=Heterodera trifolii TaxID=157864 RepID=A0ABD2K400_9BILA